MGHPGSFLIADVVERPLLLWSLSALHSPLSVSISASGVVCFIAVDFCISMVECGRCHHATWFNWFVLVNAVVPVLVASGRAALASASTWIGSVCSFGSRGIVIGATALDICVCHVEGTRFHICIELPCTYVADRWILQVQLQQRSLLWD